MQATNYNDDVFKICLNDKNILAEQLTFKTTLNEFTSDAAVPNLRYAVC